MACDHTLKMYHLLLLAAMYIKDGIEKYQKTVDLAWQRQLEIVDYSRHATIIGKVSMPQDVKVKIPVPQSSISA